jgi:hypothetical protein
VKIRRSQSLPEMSERQLTPIQMFGSRFFPQKIRNKSKRPISYISDEVLPETKRRAKKYLKKLESQQLKLGKWLAVLMAMLSKALIWT